MLIASDSAFGRETENRDGRTAIRCRSAERTSRDPNEITTDAEASS